MGESDDDFGGLDDDDLLAAETQVSLDTSFAESPRPAKKARISDPEIPHRTIIGSFNHNVDYQRAGGSEARPFELSSQQEYGTSRLGAPLNNLKQTTLFGTPVTSQQSSQQAKSHNWPLARRDEAPTHHKLDQQQLQTWVYPTNLGKTRDYQFNIVARGLYHNILVALPTGLGKTFIAATVMLNWYRWTKDSQIVFVAPTRPLVSQQVDACFKIAGIPRSATTMLTGGIPPAVRAEEWQEKRVFFMTPQTIINDLQSGICDPKRIVLVVVDEAHRATGNYAYVEVVKFLRRFNSSFRVLALTATPGSTVEGVQEVIDGLGISRVEIRTEESLDIREYVHQRNIETTLFEYSEEITFCMDHFAQALQPLVNKLRGFNAYWSANPMTLTPYGCNQAMKKWIGSDAGQRANWGLKSMVMSIFSILASLAHAIELLKFHGIGPFFHKLVDFRSETQAAGGKGSKYKKEVIESGPFQKLMKTVQAWINNKDFIGHPKLEALRSVALNHFMDAGEGRGVGAEDISPARTRIMVFAHYRDSAEEVARVLNRNSPMVRSHVFVGQANSKGSEGMDQKKQLDVIEKFRSGVYNTLVATSIGEEGLDIGEVDLIICYDGSASPIRMLQRMGRTGRKRSGRIEVLLMKDKEHDNFMKAKDNYEKMQEMIASGKRFTFHDNLSPRIVPREIQPEVDKRVVEIPVENTQEDLPEPRRRAKPGKRPPKRFNMPDGVDTGFTKASRLSNRPTMAGPIQDEGPCRSPSPVPIPPNSMVFLTDAETADLERTYLSVSGEEAQTVELPHLDKHPALQRLMRPTAYLQHGRASRGMVAMLGKMHQYVNASAATVTAKFETALEVESRELIDASLSQDHQPNLSVDDDILFGISSGTTEQQHLHEDKSTQFSLQSESIVADDSDIASDLADFIDDSEEIVRDIERSSCSSPPPTMSTNSSMAKATFISSSQASGEIPDVDQLLQRPKGPRSPAESGKRKQRQRRAVIASESDDE